LRPDLSHVVLGPADRSVDRYLYAQVDPNHPSAWREPAMAEYLDGVLVRGWKVEIIIDEIRFDYVGG
jgi:hypothetical protein